MITEIHTCSYHCQRPECVLAQRDELREAVAERDDLLNRIAEFAHEHSTGPAVPDAYWEIRAMAYAGTES